MDWVSDVPSGAWAGLLTPAIIALMMIFTRSPVKPDEDGFIRLRPSVPLHLFGILCIPLGVLFTAMPFLGFLAENRAQLIVFLALGPPLALLMWSGVYAIYIVRTRFNSEGIEYRGIRGTQFIPWSEIHRIVDGVWLGTYISTNRGRLLVWKLMRGFPQLVEEALQQHIEVDEGLLKASKGDQEK